MEQTTEYLKNFSEWRNERAKAILEKGNPETLDDGFFRMRNNPQKITCGLDLFHRGLSTRDVQSHFGAFFPHNCDHSTILRWAYAKKFMDY